MQIATLKEIAAIGLAYIRTLPDVADAEIFVSSISHLLTRINFTSSIPCNGLEEPKSTLSYGIGVQIVFKDGDRKRIGFGSQAADITLDGVKEAVEKARLSAVEDPDFHSLPPPSAHPLMRPDYHDNAIMNLGDEGFVELGWRALEGAIKTFREHNITASVIIGGDVSIVQEKMAIASTTGVNAYDEAASASAFITAMIESDNAKGSGYEVEMRLGGFAPEKAGSSAAMSAIKSRHGRSVSSGKYNLILGPQPVADLLGNIILPSLNIAVVDAASSAFAGQYGKEVADRRISIYDDGALNDYPMSRRYTCEGLATGRTELIKAGVLTGYLSNNYYRNKVLNDSSANDKIGADPTTIESALIPRNGFRSGESMLRCFRGRPTIVPTNVIVETTGAIPSDELVRTVGDGIYIGRIWYTYPINGLLAGDFTCTVIGDSYLIENGRIAAPLKPNSIRLADNIRNLLNQVTGVTSDRKPTLLWGSPEVIYSPEIAVRDINVFSIGG
ncbi:MAG: TldD/PmbA family protein [Nitrospirae bacterium]|nr:TldD/PmbA family protein [Nitrospirota bacterium]